jgi:hypothetical protein
VVRSAMTDTVAPCCCSSAARAASGPSATPSSSIQRRLPIRTLRTPTLAFTAASGHRSRTLSGASNSIPLAFAAATTARASGCSLPLCRLAAALSSASLSAPSMETSAVSSGLPSVRVPVLSKATMSTLWASSSACASLIRMPNFAATPVPGHDRCRRGQPQCARAGNHQHGHRVDHRRLEWRAGPPQPGQQGSPAPPPAPPARTPPPPGPPGAG